MEKKPVFLVAFLEQDNLGVGYIASMLLKENFQFKIVDFRIGKERILEQILKFKPAVVGFSIIFQYHIEEFKDLIDFLRNNGVNSHFSAGGHYPSLRHNELLGIIDQLDSVVLFEGEYTFLELVKSIHNGKDWKHIPGITYRENDSNIVNAYRPLEDDLDNFPPPVRQPLKEYALGKKYATILAGRGCVYDCSFCSIREFYSIPPGKLKRRRRPEMVVREMELLHQELDCSVFMFQDDDFPVGQKKEKEWVTTFCNLLTEKGLNKKILWKINCRPDEVDAETMTLMKENGLFLVYLGIESGTDDGLHLMNKHIKARENMEAVNLLKQLDLCYDYGFMLFVPTTTYESIEGNLAFLETMCGDGTSPVTFCKMLPYAETKIEHRLKKEGRLKGKPGFEDYDFTNLSINHLHSFMVDCFADWMGDHDGLLNTARWSRYYLNVYRKYFDATPQFDDLHRQVHDLISQSNLFFINTIRESVSIFNTGNGEYNVDTLDKIRVDAAHKHGDFLRQLEHAIDRLEYMVHE